MLYLSPLSAVCDSVSVSVPYISVQRFLLCSRSNTSRGPNVGLMLARHLRRWANVSPVLGYRVVFGATLNVCQRHRRRANINPASMKYWPGLNGYWQAPATLAQYVTDIGSVSACTRRQQHALPDPRPGNTRRWTIASLMLGQRCRWLPIWLSPKTI